MTSIGDVGEQLARALAVLPSEQLGTAADALDVAKTAVYPVAAESDPLELDEGYQQLERASDEAVNALRACTNAREHVLAYLAGIGWMRHGDNPPSLPRPSTTRPFVRALLDGHRLYASEPGEVTDVLRAALSGERARGAFLYVWDRPFDKTTEARPGCQLRVNLDASGQWAARWGRRMRAEWLAAFVLPPPGWFFTAALYRYFHGGTVGFGPDGNQEEHDREAE